MRETSSKLPAYAVADEKYYPAHIAAAYSALALIAVIILGTLSYHPF